MSLSAASNSQAPEYSKEYVESIIAVRKLEKKKRVQNKLKREIEAIKGGPLDVFPMKVWKKIFSFVDHPEDAFSVARTSPKFRDIVVTKDPLLLLPEVLLILRERKYIEEDGVCQMREASKWCRFSYDWAFYESQFAFENWHLNFNGGFKVNLSGEREFESCLSFESGEDLEDFMMTFAFSPISKIWTRNVEVVLPNELNQRHDNALEQFFREFGSSIWVLHVNGRKSVLPLSQLYIKISSWASHLVNLKALNIEHYPPYLTSLHATNLPVGYGMSEVVKLVLHVPVFPAIPTLRSYKANGVPFSIFSAKILESNPGIRRVLTDLKYAEDVSNAVLHRLNIDCFGNFSRYYYYPFPPNSNDHFSTLQFAFDKWPLKKICLRLDLSIPLAMLAGCLNKFKSTLEQVFIVYEGTFNIGKISPDLVFNLPKVKHFQLHQSDSYFPIQSLYPMVSLEILDLSVCLAHSEYKEVLTVDPHNSFIDFYPAFFANRVGQSNIWKLFPSLKKLRFKMYVYIIEQSFVESESEFVKIGDTVLRAFHDNSSAITLISVLGKFFNVRSDEP